MHLCQRYLALTYVNQCPIERAMYWDQETYQATIENEYRVVYIQTSPHPHPTSAKGSNNTEVIL